MSGVSQRFQDAGYKIPKYLIEVESKPIIAHIVDMFPGEFNFIFICSKDHLNDPNLKLKEILNRYCPSGKIIGIDPHKLGPVHAILQIESSLKALDSPVVVNYCDFTCYWDWYDFKEKVLSNDSINGAIPSYKGFHPHSLGNTNYAYLKSVGKDVVDIQEKKSFTKNKMKEHASTGTYYFSSIRLMYEAFKFQIKNNLHVNGEYYVSMAYKYLFCNGRHVINYEVQHFMQWGTPEDLREYLYWSHLFKWKKSHVNREYDGVTIIPMAGFGLRFKEQLYKKPKALINVDGKPMIVRSLDFLPTSKNYLFVLREDASHSNEIMSNIQKKFPSAQFKILSKSTSGQAITSKIGLKSFLQSNKNYDKAVTFGVCDTGIYYNHSIFDRYLARSDIDIMVWGVKDYPYALKKPNSYGWAVINDDYKVTAVSVKKLPSGNQNNCFTMTGIFTFKNHNHFLEIIENLEKIDSKVNGEYYIDSCIDEAVKMGLNCYVLPVNYYLCWGTPEELKTYRYWKSTFRKWPGFQK